MKITVRLNGTKENPWHKYGLKQNPFPQLGKAQYDAACLRVQSLGGDPIPNADYIRERLAGFSKEFVAGCVERFKPGELVEFVVEWPE